MLRRGGRGLGLGLRQGTLRGLGPGLRRGTLGGLPRPSPGNGLADWGAVSPPRARAL